MGHARTFWAAAQRARRAGGGGALVLRNDDLDGERSRREVRVWSVCLSLLVVGVGDKPQGCWAVLGCAGVCAHGHGTQCVQGFGMPMAAGSAEFFDPVRLMSEVGYVLLGLV